MLSFTDGTVCCAFCANTEQSHARNKITQFDVPSFLVKHTLFIVYEIMRCI
jgi:hypothetical protein